MPLQSLRARGVEPRGSSGLTRGVAPCGSLGLSVLPSFHPSILHSFIPSFLHSFIPSFHPSILPSFLLSPFLVRASFRLSDVTIPSHSIPPSFHHPSVAFFGAHLSDVTNDIASSSRVRSFLGHSHSCETLLWASSLTDDIWSVHPSGYLV